MSNIHKVKEMISEAAIYIKDGDVGFRINYIDEDGLSFNATSEEDGEEVNFLFTEVDLDNDLIYKLVLMNA